jgi:hypothetical protein
MSADELHGRGLGTDGFSDRALGWVRQALCGLHGHDTLLQFEQERMFLKCVSCGHETPGWELNEAPPTVRMRGDARRHALVRPRFVEERRIA